METRNQNRPDYRRREDRGDRWESSYRQEWRPEPFDEFRGYGMRNNDRGYSHRNEEDFNGDWRDDARHASYEHPYRDDRDQLWQKESERDNRGSYREDYDPRYEGNSRNYAYDRQGDEDRRDYYDTSRQESYKGRYYGRPQSEQDLREIRRRYEESRRNSGWTNAYLPLNNY